MIITMIEYNQLECLLDFSSWEVRIKCVFELPKEVP